jgi:hypothetical protein
LTGVVLAQSPVDGSHCYHRVDLHYKTSLIPTSNQLASLLFYLCSLVLFAHAKAMFLAGERARLALLVTVVDESLGQS